MYGMGGSFGGMPYESRAGALANGISAGYSMVMEGKRFEEQKAEREQARQDKLDQMTYERNREDRLDKMHQAQQDFAQRHVQDEEQRQHINDELTATTRAKESLSNEALANRNQYGEDPNKWPIEVQNDFNSRRDAVNGRWNAAMSAIHGNFMSDELNFTKETLKAMQGGTFDWSDPSAPNTIHRVMTALGNNDPADYLPGVNGAPSKVEQHLSDFNAGGQSGDVGQQFSGAQGILQNQVNTNLGEVARDGSTITGKTLVGTVPAQHADDELHPVLAIDGQHADGSTSQAPAEPMTQHGGVHTDNQSLVSANLGDMHNYIGQQGTLAALVRASPQLQQYIAQAGKKPPQESLDTAAGVAALGVKTKYGSAHYYDDETGRYYVKTDEFGVPTGSPVRYADAAPKARAERDPSSGIDDKMVTEEEEGYLTRMGLRKDPDHGGWTMQGENGAAGATPDWKTQAKMQAGRDYITQTLRQAKMNRENVDLGKVRTNADLMAQQAIAGVPDLTPNERYQSAKPVRAPDTGEPSYFEGDYIGGDPREPRNFRNITWYPASKGTPPPLPRHGAGGGAKADYGSSSSPEQRMTQPPGMPPPEVAGGRGISLGAGPF